MSDYELKPAWPVSESLPDDYWKTHPKPGPMPTRIEPTQEHYAGDYPAQYERLMRASGFRKRSRRRR